MTRFGILSFCRGQEETEFSKRKPITDGTPTGLNVKEGTLSS